MASVVGATSTLQALSLELSKRISRPFSPSSSSATFLFLGEKGAFSGLPLPKLATKRIGALNRADEHEIIRTFAFKTAAVASTNSILTKEDFEGIEFGSNDNLSYFGSETGSEPEDDENNLDIAKLDLPEELVQALAKRGITALFPVQRAVLTPALEGRDLIARAKTGTGKTLAFGIPIIRRLTDGNNGKQLFRRSARLPRALVLAPTRELAKQVEKEFKESAPFLSTVCIYGGVSYSLQERTLSRGVDVVVGTPGRIIDLINNDVLRLNEVQFLVLDEADQMLAVGFAEDVDVILEKLPTERQSMLFSATMPAWVKKLSRKHLNDPMTIDLVGDDEEKLAEGIKLYAVGATMSSKRSILSDLITVYAKGGKTIVFTQTKRDADDVSSALSSMGFACEALHGDISQYQRERTLNGFREGKYSVLVATDVAARGLDIPNVDLVIHYELPNDPETFVHRSGRTGRAGKEGIAILMYADKERRTVKSLERDVGCTFEFVSPPLVQDVLQSSAQHVVKLLGKVHPELKDIFLPTAKQLLDKEGTDAFAAALAHLSGYSQPPASRSLITHEEGWITLQITRDSIRGGGRPLISTRAVTGTISEIFPKAADQMGRICLIDGDRVEGAVFDLPEDVAKELLSKQALPGDTIQAITKLPKIQEDEPPMERYGRFSSRGGARNRGSRGWRDSNDGRRSSSWGRSSYGQDGRGSRGWRDNGDVRKSSSRGGSSYSQDNNQISRSWRDSDDVRKSGSWRKSSYGQDDWLGGGEQRNRAFSSGDRDMSFRGTCFVCGQSGHRAVDCPSK
eukprot:Gb_04849 [translate_table: standard]